MKKVIDFFERIINDGSSHPSSTASKGSVKISSADIVHAFNGLKKGAAVMKELKEHDDLRKILDKIYIEKIVIDIFGKIKEGEKIALKEFAESVVTLSKQGSEEAQSLIEFIDMMQLRLSKTIDDNDEEEEEEDEYGEAGSDSGNDINNEEEDEEDIENLSLSSRVILRGYMKKSSKGWIWKGVWGESEDAFNGNSTKKSNFQLVYSGDATSSSKVPPSGKYSGYFLLKNDEELSGFNKIKEPKVRLTFKLADDKKRYNVLARGENPFGRFLIEGIYDPSQSKLGAAKYYIVDEDEADDDIGDDMDGHELDDLKHIADIPIEELRAKLDAESAKQSSAKKQRI